MSDQPENPIVRFFLWWNRACRDDGFTAEGFERFFTDDAPFIVDGDLRGAGPAEIAAHFQRVRAATEAVELILPVEATLANDTLGFVHYRATARIEGKDKGEACMAVARFRDGRIASFEVIGRAT